MTAPLTAWETDGTFTTHAEETAFLTQIAADTSAVMSSAGQSAGGVTLNRLDIGTPTRGTWLIVAMQHGNECSPREGALAFVRDLAYSTDPAIVSYLATHRIVLLAGVNPDGFPTSRFNANGQDPNRSHYGLIQPEAMAIAKTIRAAEAALITDVHGRDDITSGDDWQFAVTGTPSTHPALLDMAQDLAGHVTSAAAGHGYLTTVYPPSSAGTGTLQRAAGLHHAICLLSETWGQGGSAARIPVTANMLEAARQWHAANSDDLAAARTLSKSAAAANTGPYTLEVDATTKVTYFPAPDGYAMTDRTVVPTRLADGFGITADATGFVTMAQDARPAIPLVMDTDSAAVNLPATRVGGTIWEEPEPEPEPEPELQLAPVGIPEGYRVNLGGHVHDVKRVLSGISGGYFVVWERP